MPNLHYLPLTPLHIDPKWGLEQLNAYLAEVALLEAGVPYAELGIGQRRHAMHSTSAASSYGVPDLIKQIQRANANIDGMIIEANTVTVRYRIAALTGSEDPASGIFKVAVTK